MCKKRKSLILEIENGKFRILPKGNDEKFRILPKPESLGLNTKENGRRKNK